MNTLTGSERVREIVAPLASSAGFELYDMQLAGGVLQVLVDRSEGADIDAISTLARSISRALDEADPIEGRYTLEVSSPGLERPLRTPEHFCRAAEEGMSAKLKTKPGVEGERRVEGVVATADTSTVTVRTASGTERTLRYDDIEKARTTFEWDSNAKRRAKA